VEHGICPIAEFTSPWRNCAAILAIRPQVRAKLHIFYCACMKRPYVYFRSKIWRHHRVPWSRFAIRFRNFGESATNKGKNCIFFHSACAKRPYFYFLSKIWRHHPVRRPRFLIWCRNFGDSAINMGQIAYFSLRMRKTALFLLPVKNLTSALYSPTPISLKTREFWRYVNI